jgi:hypothetical protein
MTLKYPDSSVLRYYYCAQGIIRVKDITESDNAYDYVKSIQYSATNQITGIVYGNGTHTDYAYNPKTLRLSNFTTTSPLQGKIQQFAYKFDKSGNVTFINDYINSATQSFVYDELSRLISASGLYGSLNYEYDSIGNMLNKEGVVLSYGKAGRLPHAVTQFGDIIIDYDANGNMVKKGDMNLEYDIENRLTKVSEKTTTADVEIELVPGWNFISFPIILSAPKISSVFADVIADIGQVSRYNASTSAFEHFINNPKYDQFSSFEYGKGYQVYYNGQGATTIKLHGSLPEKPFVVALKKNKNLIFCPKVRPTAVEKALLPLKLGVNYSKVIC